MLVALDRYDEAEELLRRSLRTTESLGDSAAASRALEGLGLIASRRGRFDHAVELLERSLELAGDADPEERFELYRELARLHGEGTNLPRAIELLERCLAGMSARPDHDRAKMVGYTVYLSYAYADRGDYGHATAVLTEALRGMPRTSTAPPARPPTARCRGCTRSPARRRSRSTTPAAASRSPTRPGTSGSRQMRTSCSPTCCSTTARPTLPAASSCRPGAHTATA